MITPNKKIYISLAIFFIVLFFLIFFGVYPVFSDIKKNSEDLISEKEKLVLFEKEVEGSREVEAIYKTYQQDLKRIDSLFINPEFPIEFILFLEENAKNSQIKIEISPGAKKREADPWPNISFQISTIGSFSNFLKFLDRLENSSYLVEIFNLNIKRLTEGELDAIEGIFSLKVFTK